MQLWQLVGGGRPPDAAAPSQTWSCRWQQCVGARSRSPGIYWLSLRSAAAAPDVPTLIRDLCAFTVRWSHTQDFQNKCRKRKKGRYSHSTPSRTRATKCKTCLARVYLGDGWQLREDRWDSAGFCVWTEADYNAFICLCLWTAFGGMNEWELVP